MKKTFLKYIAALLLFGSNGIVASHISLTSYQIVFMRTGIGSVLLVLLFVLSQRKTAILKNKMDVMYIALSGVAMGFSWIFLYEAYSQVGVGVSSLLYYCGPVIVMILSPLLFKERLTAQKIIGFIIVLTGIFFVNGNMAKESVNVNGLICGGIAAVMYSLMVIFNKYAEKIAGIEKSMLQLLASFLTVALFTCAKGGLTMCISTCDWIWVLILGLINTGMGCYLYFSSIGALPVQTVAICGYLEPLSAVVLSVLILNEVLLPVQIAGAVLIVCGALIGENVCCKMKKLRLKKHNV